MKQGLEFINFVISVEDHVIYLYQHLNELKKQIYSYFYLGKIIIQN